jgi:ankyrin repeat protein
MGYLPPGHGAPFEELRPLEQAVLMGNTDDVRELIARGANVNEGQALHAAVLKCDRTMVELLLSYGARVDLKAPMVFRDMVYKLTPLELAEMRKSCNDKDSIISLLKRHKSNGKAPQGSRKPSQ